MSDRSDQLRALTARLKHKGEAVLHLMPDGGSEWLWGYFRSSRSEAISGLEIDLQNNSPRFRLLSSDAVQVRKYRTSNFNSADDGSKLVIRGQEYPVRDKHVTDCGEAILELSSECNPARHPMDPPRCMAAVTQANTKEVPCVSASSNTSGRH